MLTRLAVLGCEISWAFYSSTNRIKYFFKRAAAPDTAMRSSPFFLHRMRLAERRIYLRERLQEHPYWAQGHTRLGLCELELELTNEGPRSQRTLGAIRTSALAARELCGAQQQKGRVLLEADYLLALLDFLDKNYAAALAALEQLIQPEPSRQLTSNIYWDAVEHAGASALVLGKTEEARMYYSKIPERLRNAAQFSARRYFEALEKAD